jgi:coenzyme PQQ synthesis protein D (PqqD)
MIRLTRNLRTITSPDGAVILDLRRGKMFRLNATGAMVIEHLIRGDAEPCIAAEISRRLRVDLAVASADVRAFLASLESRGLLDADDAR